MNVKRWMFVQYNNAIRVISQTGVARKSLPLEIRKAACRTLERIVRITSLHDEGPFEVLGSKMWIGRSSPSVIDMVYGTYEHDTVRVFQKLVKPGMTVVVVRTHVGFYTLLAARLVGTGRRVYGFEPNPEVYGIVARNIQINGYQGIVRVVPKGVSKEKRTIKLYIPKKESGEASFYPQKVAGRSVEVETVSLDVFLAGEGWPKVSLVKIDVEGAEVEALEGMRELVRESENLKLIVGFNPENQIRVCGSNTKLFETLLALGFKRFYAIRHGLRRVDLPNDVKELIHMTDTAKYVNLLCEV
ncbi:MAG: hypothetical protein DRN12_07420 [Thermoplasmata archaeon]|nr:MAG: hypothetical protein DRN12_07420 [Thermoplasmata archaeon]